MNDLVLAVGSWLLETTKSAEGPNPLGLLWRLELLLICQPEFLINKRETDCRLGTGSANYATAPASQA